MPALPIQTKLGGFYFFYYAIVGTFMPYWSLYLQDQGFNYAVIGVLSSIAILTRFVAPFLWGWIADKTGRRMFWIRLATCMEALIWFVIFIIPNDFQSIALLMLIFSFFQNAILAQFEGVTLFWLGKDREKLYGRVRKWGSIGFIIGVFGIGAILEVIDIRYLPMLLLCIASLTFIWSLGISEPDTAPQSQKQLQPLWPVLKQPVVACLFIIEFILLFAQAPFYSFYSNFLSDAGYSTSLIGFLWAIGVVAEILMFANATRLLNHYSWRSLVTVCILGTGLRFVIVGVFPDLFWMQLLSQCLHALSFGLFHLIAMRIIFSHFDLTQQGRAQAVYSTMWGMGVASGSILAGYYWHSVSPNWVFILAGCSTVLALFFLKGIPNTLVSSSN